MSGLDSQVRTWGSAAGWLAACRGLPHPRKYGAPGRLPLRGLQLPGKRRRCGRPGCRHAPSRHREGRCSCGCSRWVDRWPHAWRSLVVGTWRDADAAWFLQAEAAGYGYQTETAEWAAAHPRPTLKKTMQDLAGTGRAES